MSRSARVLQPNRTIASELGWLATASGRLGGKGRTSRRLLGRLLHFHENTLTNQFLEMSSDSSNRYLVPY